MGSLAAARHSSVATFAFNHCSADSPGTPCSPFGRVAILQRAYHETAAGAGATRTVLGRAAYAQRTDFPVAAAPHATPLCCNHCAKSLSRAVSRTADRGGAACAPWVPRGADLAITPGDPRLRGGGVSVSMTERLRLDAARTVEEIAAALRQQVGQVLRRSGMVVAMSGGVDSSVCAGLAVRAVGPGRVLGLALPERESDGESLVLAREW